jgi:hypothetical protein
MCVEQDDWSCHGTQADFVDGGAGQAKGSAVRYETVAEAYRDLERGGGRLALIDRLTALLARTRPSCCPRSATCARA